ncbi:MAG TPA: S41 family peptidase, partial [Haliangiales bacterium]|nr:S41 family peptidase [Haliangiales bacterium]
AEEWPASRIRADAAPPVRRLGREPLDGVAGEIAVAAETRPRPGGTPPPFAMEADGRAIVFLARSLDVAREAAAHRMEEIARRVRDGARGLVVDLRGDGGGTEQIAVIIASALSPRVVVGGSRRVRLSARARAARPEWRDLAEDTARPGWSADLPLATTGGGMDPGPIAVLIDAGCRSSCEQLALLLRAGGARLFGETTGGSSGAPIEVHLPQSGAWVEIPAWALVDPSGDPVEGHGVVPDEAVAPTRADVAAGRDPVRARALAWVAGR